MLQITIFLLSSLGMIFDNGLSDSCLTSVFRTGTEIWVRSSPAGLWQRNFFWTFHRLSPVTVLVSPSLRMHPPKENVMLEDFFLLAYFIRILLLAFWNAVLRQNLIAVLLIACRAINTELIYYIWLCVCKCQSQITCLPFLTLNLWMFLREETFSNMKCFEPQWDLSHSGSWLPHLQTNGVEKFNLPVTESSSLGKIQICVTVKINEEYFSWVRSNILRMLAKTVSEKRCAELLYIMARSKYSICRSCFSCNFYFCHLCDVLVSLIQCAHLIIAFSDVTTVLCISLPKAGGVSSELLFIPGYQTEGAVLGAKGRLLHPLDAGEFLKSIFTVHGATWVGPTFSVRNPLLASY